MMYAEMTRYKDVPIMARVKAAINYWRFFYCYNKRLKITILNIMRKKAPSISGFWTIVKPIGYVIYINDKRLTK